MRRDAVLREIAGVVVAVAGFIVSSSGGSTFERSSGRPVGAKISRSEACLVVLSGNRHINDLPTHAVFVSGSGSGSLVSVCLARVAVLFDSGVRDFESKESRSGEVSTSTAHGRGYRHHGKNNQ